MAQIEKLLISASTEEAFLQSLAAQEIPDYAIVFIEDTNKIYAKGVYYPCPYTKEELDAKFAECNENIETVINSLKGSNNGLASLDSTGKVPASQLPSYVDDVLEYNNRSGFPGTGESGKIYIAKDTNLTYRWSGSAYVEISQSLALGETSSTAYPGNKGKQNADNIASLQTKTTNIDNYTVNGKKISTNPTISKGDVGLGNVNNTSDANKPISTATQSALNQKQNTLVSGTNIKTINGTSILGSGNLEIQSGISSIPTATAQSLGGIKIGFTESGKNYPVELSSGGQAFVNVPWTDNNTTYNNATTSTAGLMSAADKTKLEGIATGANKYVHPTTSGNKHIPAGGSSGQILRWASDGTAQWGNDNNTTYSVATSSSNGLMSSADKAKLDGIASGANKTTVDSTLSSSSTNPVQNKVINSALSGKANTNHTHTISQISDLHVNWDTYLKANPKLINSAISFESQGLNNLNDLNDVGDCGFYYAGGSNSVQNKPSGVDNFSLLVLRAGSGVISQVLFSSTNEVFVRYNSTTGSAAAWTAWTELANKSDLTWANISGKPTIPSAYTLPTATSSRLGGVKVGAGLSVAGDGTLSVSSGGVADSVEWDNVVGKPSSFTPSSHTHPSSQITGLTASRALVSDSSGHPAVSTITSTELGYLDGVTSNIQTQINNKSAVAFNSSWSIGKEIGKITINGSPTTIYAPDYSIATTIKPGLVKPASVISKPEISVASTTIGRYYHVQMSSDGNMFVNVPWSNTTYTLATTTTPGLVKPFSVIEKPTINSPTQTASRYYHIQMSTDGNMFVNIPWINTTYSLATTSSQGLLKTLSGEQREVLTGDGNWATISQYLTIQSADTSGSSNAILTLDTSIRDSTSLLILDTETEINIPSNRRIRIRKGETSSYYVSLPIEQGYTFYPGIYYLMLIYNDRLYPINIHFPNTYSSNTWTAYQDFSAGAGNSGSDMRFKSEVSNVSNTLEAINKLNVIKYIWEHPDEKKVYNTFGVNADQLLDLGGIYATMVHTRPDQYNTKWVEYDRFGVLAIKGLQEINQKLEQKCSELEQKCEKYENALKKVEDKLGIKLIEE